MRMQDRFLLTNGVMHETHGGRSVFKAIYLVSNTENVKDVKIIHNSINKYFAII